jgi:hypothetical protein
MMKTAGSLLILALVFYAAMRIARVFGGLPCVIDDLYGGAREACRASIREGRSDSWAPYVVGAFLLYVAGSIGYLIYDAARDGEWPAVGLLGLWILAILLFCWLS